MREHRIALGMTQDRLAAYVGVDKRQVRRYEAGQTQPALDVAARIAAALGITLDQLAGYGSGLLDLSGQWWLCRRGDHLAPGAQLLSVRAGLAGAYVVRATAGTVRLDPRGHVLRGELRVLDQALVGWYAGEGEGAPTGTLFLLIGPGALSAVGRWVGKSGQGPISSGVAALARTEGEAAALADPGHGGGAR